MKGRSPQPLAGRRIVVTRRSEQSGSLVARLSDLGATVIELPLIEVTPPADMAPLDAALRGLGRYDWVVFTSANAVRSLSDRMTDLGLAERALTGRKVASVGPATTRTLTECFTGLVVSAEAARHDAEALLGELAAGARGLRFLLPTSDRARDVLPEGLRRAGATVDVVTAYRTVAPSGLRDRVLECLRREVDLVTFASPSAVENLKEAVPERIAGIRAAVIGSVTEDACRRAGIDVVAVAVPATADGLVTSMERLFSRP